MSENLLRVRRRPLVQHQSESGDVDHGTVGRIMTPSRTILEEAAILVYELLQIPDALWLLHRTADVCGAFEF